MKNGQARSCKAADNLHKVQKKNYLTVFRSHSPGISVYSSGLYLRTQLNLICGQGSAQKILSGGKAIL